MRRTHLHGTENIEKRYLIHVSGFNLGLLMRSFGDSLRRGKVTFSTGCYAIYRNLFFKGRLVIEAIQYIGENIQEVLNFIGESRVAGMIHSKITIKTLEGNRNTSVGDWIIKGVAGEFYPCKPDIFASTYEPVSGGSLDRIDELAKGINILALDHGYTVNITVNTLVEGPRDIFGSLISREGCHLLSRPLGFTSLKPSE